MLKIKPFVFNPFMENTFVLYDETKEAIVIDCGAIYEEEENELKSFIENNSLSVKHLLNTHLHLDHQFGNAFFTHTFGIMPEAHKDDEAMIDSLASQSIIFGIPQKIKSQKLGRYIEDKEVISLGNTSLMALHIPGHSAGSLCFYSECDKVLISGDVLFAGSIGRTDLPGGSFEQLISGIKQKLFVLPSDTTVYPGHGPTTTIGTEITNNPFFI